METIDDYLVLGIFKKDGDYAYPYIGWKDGNLWLIGDGDSELLDAGGRTFNIVSEALGFISSTWSDSEFQWRIILPDNTASLSDVKAMLDPLRQAQREGTKMTEEQEYDLMYALEDEFSKRYISLVDDIIQKAPKHLQESVLFLIKEQSVPSYAFMKRKS